MSNFHPGILTLAQVCLTRGKCVADSIRSGCDRPCGVHSLSVASHNCVVGVETPESHTQVVMYGGGQLAVYNNVVLEANAAGDDGGAVSNP